MSCESVIVSPSPHFCVQGDLVPNILAGRWVSAPDNVVSIATASATDGGDEVVTLASP